MISVVVVMVDKCLDLVFEINRLKVIFEQDTVLQSLMPALNLTLDLRVVWRTASVIHAFTFEIIS